jgi:D-3-phosphoglycerate dehydrogenase
MTKPLVLLTDPLQEDALKRLSDTEVMLLPDMRPESYRPLMRKAHILVVRRGSPLPDDILEDAPNLIGIVRHGTGLDVIPMTAAERLAIPVANVPGGNAQAVAELGVVLMGMLMRRIHKIDWAMRSRDWNRAQQEAGGVHNLSGKTVGIVGLGAVGKRLASICHDGFGMQVLGHQRHMNNMPEYVRPVDLDSLFSSSDFVVLCCPLTPQTQRLCSAPQLNLMKPSAFLVNLARGGLIDTASLIAALETGRPAGAGLDVFEEEPLPQDHPLLRSERVILTPHIAYMTAETLAYNGDMTVTQVLQLLQGKAPTFLVNPQVWERSIQRREAIIATLECDNISDV